MSEMINIDRDHALLQRKFRNEYVDEQVYKRMLESKMMLMEEFPFWGVVASDLVLIEDTPLKDKDGKVVLDDKGKPTYLIPTAATDGRHIIYNPDFIRTLRDGEVTFLIAHEAYHVLFDHVGSSSRRLTREPQLWNIASDAFINLDLKTINVGEFITSIKIVYDPKYEKMSSEEIYNILEKDPENQMLKQQLLDVHVEIEETEDEQPGDQNGGAQSGDQDGECDGGQKPSKGGSGQQPGSGSGQVEVRRDPKTGNITIKIKRPKSEAEADRGDQQGTIRRALAAQEEAEREGRVKSAGSVPAGILREFGDLKPPRVDWRTALRRYIQWITRTGYSYARPNKPLFDLGYTLPGYRKRNPDLKIAIAIDGSGSVSKNQITKFVSEIKGMVEQFNTCTLELWCFDGDVIRESHTTLTKAHKSDMRGFEKSIKKVSGGGGTIFESNWVYMKEKKMRPKALVLFTDGYPCGEWGEKDYCPVLYVISTHDADADNLPGPAPFGTTIYVDERDFK